VLLLGIEIKLDPFCKAHVLRLFFFFAVKVDDRPSKKNALAGKRIWE